MVLSRWTIAKSMHARVAETLKARLNDALEVPRSLFQAVGSVNSADACRLGDALRVPLTPRWHTVNPFWPNTSRSAPWRWGVHASPWRDSPSSVLSVRLGFASSFALAVTVSGVSFAG